MKDENMRDWKDVLASARSKMTKCRACPECNGLACRGETPGCGGKGSGESFVRNVSMLKQVKLNLDTIVGNEPVSCEADFFGVQTALPVYVAPIGGIKTNYGAEMSEAEYARALIEGCKDKTVVFTGDGVDFNMFQDPLLIQNEVGGQIVPTFKPWIYPEIAKRIEAVKKAGFSLVCSDIDAAGLTALRNSAAPVQFRNSEELKQLIEEIQMPLIVKGIMSVKGAMKALEAGAAGIVVSNHGGRVLDDCSSSIEVLPEIAEAVNGRMKIFVDGGFRSGKDVFKALALGADGVLIGRPFSLAAIGDGREGVKIYLNKLENELKETMQMCGCTKLSDIHRSCVRITF